MIDITQADTSEDTEEDSENTTADPYQYQEPLKWKPSDGHFYCIPVHDCLKLQQYLSVPDPCPQTKGNTILSCQ